MYSVWILALLGAAHAFVMPAASFARTRPVFSASLGNPNTDKFANRFLVDQELWLQELQSEEVKKVRRELVQKYVGMGKNAEVAEREVDAFLADPKKSQPFLEMRLSALKKAYDDMGLGIIVQTVAIFFFCLFATVGLQYYTAYKVWACFVVCVVSMLRICMSRSSGVVVAGVFTCLALWPCSPRSPMETVLFHGCND